MTKIVINKGEYEYSFSPDEAHYIYSELKKIFDRSKSFPGYLNQAAGDQMRGLQPTDTSKMFGGLI